MADSIPSPSSPSDKPLVSPSATLLTGGLGASLSLVDATDDVIPPVHTHRTLVLCFDGTGDQFDADVCFSLDILTSQSHDALPAELEHHSVFFHVEEG